MPVLRILYDIWTQQACNEYKNSDNNMHCAGYSESLISLIEESRRCFLCVGVFSACLRLFWFNFFPASGVVGTVSSPSVEVTSVGWLAYANALKHASLAFWHCIGDMVLHTSTVSRCLAKAGTSIKSPRPQIAWSASTYWHVTSSRNFSIKSGNCCGRHCTYSFLLYYSLSLPTAPSRLVINTPPAASGVLGHAHRHRCGWWGRWSIRLHRLDRPVNSRYYYSSCRPFQQISRLPMYVRGPTAQWLRSIVCRLRAVMPTDWIDNHSHCQEIVCCELSCRLRHSTQRYD